MIMFLNVIFFVNTGIIIEIRYTSANLGSLEEQANCIRFRHLFKNRHYSWLQSCGFLFFFKAIKEKNLKDCHPFAFFFLQPINYVSYISEVVFVLLGVC